MGGSRTTMTRTLTEEVIRHEVDSDLGWGHVEVGIAVESSGEQYRQRIHWQ